MNSLLDEVKNHYTSQLPFVVYRLPNSRQLRAWLQSTETLNYSVDFEEEGFVFAPFDSHDNAIVFKKTDCSVLEQNGYEQLTNSPKKIIEPDNSDKDFYREMVTKAIDEINKSKFSKVVVSRQVKLSSPLQEPLETYKTLVSAYPNAFVYCWFHPKIGLWMGATPELLLRLKHNRLSTVSLAGTLSIEDKADWSSKEKHEQEVVTDFIMSELKSVTDSVEGTAAKEITAGKLRHLKSEITAVLPSEFSGLKEVIGKLHPTPAVCGFPKEAAKEFILTNENYSRSYYTGFLGEINCVKERSRTQQKRNVENKAFKSLVKESQLYVNLRCMQLEEESALIYVGGGIVNSSDPEKEWNETVNKSMTMMSVL